MLGFNGGLMGVRRVPSGSAASGLWFQNEQNLAKQAGLWIRPLGTYSQSSLYSGTTAASLANMTNGSFTDAATATNADANAFVKIDYGEAVYINSVTVGTATGNIPGGWDRTYTQSNPVQTSNDDSTWTTLFTTPSFAADGIYTFYGPGSFTPVSARYVRMYRSSNYLALSEFYVN
jgi:hypothetical protein